MTDDEFQTLCDLLGKAASSGRISVLDGVLCWQVHDLVWSTILAVGPEEKKVDEPSA